MSQIWNSHQAMVSNTHNCIPLALKNCHECLDRIIGAVRRTYWFCARVGASLLTVATIRRQCRHDIIA